MLKNMTKQTKYNTTGLTCYFEPLTQIRYNPKINASNELLRKRQEFCFGIKERKKERWNCLWDAFTWENITRLSLRTSSFPFFLFFIISNLISIPSILCLCLSTDITQTIQIINCFSLVFVLWFTHSCSLSISGVVSKAESSSPALFFFLKHVSCVCVHQQSNRLIKKANKEIKIK